MNRRFLPFLCFCLSWGLARHFGSRPPAPSLTPEAVLPAATAERLPAPRPQGPAEFASRFASAPTTGWPALWETFAEAASLKDLQILSRLPSTQPLWPAMDSHKVLQGLAVEELALRGEALPESRAGTAALAERDPERAWQAVGKARASMVSAAVLRQIAIRDPHMALTKWKTLAPERGPEWNGENDVIHPPLGSIFAAWTRRDPAAAITAAAALPRRDRITAQNETALTLSYQDGPAALRYLLQFGETEGFRMDVILRSAFSQSRASSQAVAALLRDRPELMKGQSRHFLGPWYRTDPDGAAAWAAAAPPEVVDRYALIRCDPATVLHIMGSSAPEQSDIYFLATLLNHFPDQARVLAEKRGLWPEVQKRLQEYPPPHADPDPTTKLKALLAQVREHGPDQVGAASPLTFAQIGPYLDCARRYLPEAVPVLESITFPSTARKAGPYANGSPLPPHEFAWDPAAAARRLQANPVSDWDAWHAVQHWAPYDFAAAQEWVNTLPSGPQRQGAEIALLRHNPDLTGQSIMEALSAVDPADYLNNRNRFGLKSIAELWEEGLRRIARHGGDWRQWHQRIAPAWRGDDLERTRLDSLLEKMELQESVIRDLP